MFQKTKIQAMLLKLSPGNDLMPFVPRGEEKACNNLKSLMYNIEDLS